MPVLAAPLGRYRRSLSGNQAARRAGENRSISQKRQGRLTPKLSGGVVPKAHFNALFQNVLGPSGWHWTCLRRRPLAGSQTLSQTELALGDAASKSDAKDVVRFSALLGGPGSGWHVLLP